MGTESGNWGIDGGEQERNRKLGMGSGGCAMGGMENKKLGIRNAKGTGKW